MGGLVNRDNSNRQHPGFTIELTEAFWYTCTMLGKKASPMTSIDDPNDRKKLEYLYARRFTLDTLIRTLEQYDRFQAKRPEPGERQTA